MWCYVFKLTVRILQYFLVPLLWPYTRLVALWHTKRKVSPPRNPLIFLSAKTLAERIRNQEVSCVEVVNAYIERIKEVDPIVNSVVEERFQAALEEAEEVDKLVRRRNDPDSLGRETPLLGVPVTIKESIAVAGLSNNGGRRRPKERKAPADAECVAEVKRAGAIVLAVTNTPEFCLFWESYNYANGVTRNPYDSARTAGGSSGGECALMGAGASVIGLGSDIVGSGRIPALFCGTFGHKPTSKIISVVGHLPVSDDPDWSTFLTISPLCRYAEDFPLLMSCAAPIASKVLRLNEEVDIRKIRVFCLEEHKSILNHSVDGDLKKAIRRAADHFRHQYGINVQKVDFEEFSDTLEAAATIMLRMKSPQTVLQKSEDPEDWGLRDVITELLRKLVGISAHTLYSILFCLLKKLADAQSESRVQEIRLMKQSWQAKFKELLGEDGVLLLPCFPHKASLHYQLYYKLTNINYVAAFNFLEMPATHCPMGLSKGGLPLGLQIVAFKHQDRLTFAVAKELESAFGGWALRDENQSLDI